MAPRSDPGPDSPGARRDLVRERLGDGCLDSLDARCRSPQTLQLRVGLLTRTSTMRGGRRPSGPDSAAGPSGATNVQESAEDGPFRPPLGPGQPETVVIRLPS